MPRQVPRKRFPPDRGGRTLRASIPRTVPFGQASSTTIVEVGVREREGEMGGDAFGLICGATWMIDGGQKAFVGQPFAYRNAAVAFLSF